MASTRASRFGLLAAPVVFGALGLACRPSKWLDGGSDDGKNLGEAPTSTAAPGTGRRPPKAKPEEPSGKGAGRAAPTAPTSSPQGDAPTIHLALGTPTDADPSDDYLMLKTQYALSYDKQRNDPNWVSWELNATWFGDAPRFKGKFLSDDTLPSGFYRVRHEDYAGSGYDRGHMVRSEERTRSAEDNKATFYLTNILPQYHDLNAGPWLRLEEYAQTLAQRDKRELFIVAGGVFSKSARTIGHGVAVPDECFKIIVVLDPGQGAMDVKTDTRVIAVVMPNITGILGDDWGKYRTTVRELERRTGYDFLNRVPTPVAQVIESRMDGGPTR